MEEEKKDVVQEESAVEPVEEAPEVDGVTMLREATNAELVVKEPKEKELIKEEVAEEVAKSEEVATSEPVIPTPEEIEKRVKDYLSQKGSPATALPNFDVPVIKDEETGKTLTVDELYQTGKIKEAVEIQGAQIVKQVIAELSGQTQQNQMYQVRNEANMVVYKKHPELLDIDQGKAEPNDFAQEIAKVYQEFPHLLHTDPRGPIAAMEIAEARLGTKPKEAKVVKPVENKEVAAPEPVETKTVADQTNDIRDQALRAASVVTSGGGGAAPPVAGPELSDEQKLMAAKLGLTGEEYKAKKKNEPIFNAAYYAKYKDATQRPTRGGSN